MNKEIQYRSKDIHLREADTENEEKIIEGYFVVFDDETNLFDGVYEKIDKNAFSETLEKDIKALYDHDSAKVLGRTTNKTLTLKVDDHGLYGKILINDKDTEAVNLYERVKRGDINQCSFGFYVEEEETETRDDGSVLFTIKKVNLLEVSVVTFPAYSNTSVEARHKDYTNYKKKKTKIWKEQMKERMKKWH